MALHIENPKAAELALQLSHLTGRTMEEVVVEALEASLRAGSAPAEQSVSALDATGTAEKDAGAEHILELARRFRGDTKIEPFDDEHGLPH
jgi:hypothetical protein